MPLIKYWEILIQMMPEWFLVCQKCVYARKLRPILFQEILRKLCYVWGTGLIWKRRVSDNPALWFVEYLTKPTEFLALTHSLLQFHDMLQSKSPRSKSPIYSRLLFSQHFNNKYFVWQFKTSLRPTSKGKQSNDFNAPSTIRILV